MDKMGKSSKFYKKPSLKEKQAVQGKKRSSTSSSATALPSNAPIFKQVAVKKGALTGKALEKRQVLEQKSRQKEEATRAPKPVFRQAGAGLATSRVDEDEEDEDGMEDEGEQIKRRPRTRQRKDWGPMPKEMGIDYLKQWDNRS